MLPLVIAMIVLLAATIAFVVPPLIKADGADGADGSGPPDRTGR